MYLSAEKKQELFTKYGKSNTDTGSPESQVALFSYRIAHLTEHLKKNRKDFATQRSLLKLVGKRRKLLSYLKQVDIERYRAIIKELGLRSKHNSHRKRQFVVIAFCFLYLPKHFLSPKAFLSSNCVRHN